MLAVVVFVLVGVVVEVLRGTGGAVQRSCYNVVNVWQFSVGSKLDCGKPEPRVASIGSYAIAQAQFCRHKRKIAVARMVRFVYGSQNRIKKSLCRFSR
jgi:hypothetical protein